MATTVIAGIANLPLCQLPSSVPSYRRQATFTTAAAAQSSARYHQGKGWQATWSADLDHDYQVVSYSSYRGSLLNS
jgi:hypothetical protein